MLRPREVYSIAALARWAPFGAPFFMPPLAAKTGQPGFARGKQANLASLPVTPLASPLGDEGHEVAKGVQANWIHRGASRPANPVRRHPAKSVWTVVILIMILDVDVTAEGGIIKLIAP